MIETMIASSSFDLSLLPYQRIEGMKEEDLASYLIDEDKKLILLALDKKVIAFVALSISLDEAEIDYLAIRKEEEGKGYSNQLLHNAFELLKKEYQTKTVFLRSSRWKKQCRKSWMLMQAEFQVIISLMKTV